MWIGGANCGGPNSGLTLEVERLKLVVARAIAPPAIYHSGLALTWHLTLYS